MRLTWAELGEAARAPYVQQAHAERDAWQEAQGVQPEPWDADRPRKPPSVFDSVVPRDETSGNDRCAEERGSSPEANQRDIKL